MFSDIFTVQQAEEFMRQLVREGTNAHPDEDFNNYIHMATGLATYTAGEAAARNRLMEQCFGICEAAGLDVYNIMQEVFLKETGLEKYIPLPSSV